MNPALDVEAELDSVAPEVKLRCGRPSFDPGGGGVNVARALNRIGGNATALFPEGSGLGAFYRSLVEAEEVDCRTFEIGQAMRRLNTHFREKEGQHQYRFCLPGPELEESDWQRALDLLNGVLKEGDILVASGSLPPGIPEDFNVRVAKITGATGADLVLDAPGDVLRTLEYSTVTWITPNQNEFEDLLGHPVNDDRLEKEWPSFLEDSGFQNILLTLGANGALYAGAEGVERIPAPEVEKLSSVGAGDSTVAGLIMGLSCGEDHLASSRMAVAAGAAAVMTPGTKLLKKQDFHALLEHTK